MKKGILAVLVVGMTILAACSKAETEPAGTNVNQITETLKNVTDEVTQDVSELDSVGTKEGFKRVISENGELVDVFFTVNNKDYITITDVKQVNSEDSLKVLEYNNRFVKFHMNEKVYLADMHGESTFALNEENQVQRINYTLVEITEDTELPDIPTESKED